MTAKTQKIDRRQRGEKRGKNILGKKRSCMWEGPELGETEIYFKKLMKV